MSKYGYFSEGMLMKEVLGKHIWELHEDRLVDDGIWNVPLDIEILELKDVGQSYRTGNKIPHPSGRGLVTEWAQHPEEKFNAMVKGALKVIQGFMEKNPNWVLASAYETHTYLLLSRMPEPWIGHAFGSGFNYGSTNVINTKGADRLLILAQND